MPKRFTAPVCNPVQHRELTAPQSAAVPLLAAGSTDAEVGSQLGIDRATVYRWRRHSPTFQAALNTARKTTGTLMADKFRTAASAALDAILEVMASGDAPTRLKAASMILDRASFATGPTDASEIVRAEEDRRRRAAPTDEDELLATLGCGESIDQSRIRIFEELESLANADG